MSVSQAPRPFGNRPFLWGTASSAFQCEGAWREDGKGLGEWDWFLANAPALKDAPDATVASDFYHRYLEDIELAARGAQNSLRLSVSWSRIMPHGCGEVNQEGVAFYNRVIDACLDRGIEPNLTLFQYDLPYALAAKGGWSNVETAYAFRDYARACVRAFGDRVRLWSTVDEPQYYSYCATLLGIYPPAHQLDMASYLQWQYNQMLASALAIRAMHDENPDILVGVIHQDCNVELDPATKNPAAVKQAADFFYNRMILCPATEGALPPELDEMLAKLGCCLYRIPHDEEVFADGVIDFLSLNIFCRKYVTDWRGGPTSMSGNTKGAGSKAVEGQVVAPLFQTTVDPTVPRNQWGREVLPRVVSDSLRRIKDHYENPPVVVENGFGAYEEPDVDGLVADDDRIAFMQGTVENILQAKRDGADVRGYYYWSTMDLYSWINGYEKRYGLVRVDFDRECRRTPKKSWSWFRDIISHAVTE